MVSLTLILLLIALAVCIGHMIKGWPLSVAVLILILMHLIGAVRL